MVVVMEATDLTSIVPAWLLSDHDNLTRRVERLPERDEIDVPASPHLIVELYSK